jgi:hypothetical protein
VYDYYQRDYEVRTRIEARRREADAERIIRRQARERRQRRRAPLAAAWELIAARQQVGAPRLGLQGGDQHDERG